MRFIGDAAKHGERRLAVERMLAGRGFVEDAAEAEQIGAVIDAFAVSLFGGHVQRRAGDEAGAGEPDIFEAAGEAEVRELHAVADVFNEDVARLDVAVNEPAGVGGREPGRGLLPDLRYVFRGKFTHALQPLFQRFADHELHHEVRQLRNRVFNHLMHGDEVVVRHGGGGPRLAAEPLVGHLVVRELRVEHLDRDIPFQVRIVALKHDAHAAATDDALDVEPVEPPDVVRIVTRLKELQVEVGRDDGFIRVGVAVQRIGTGRGDFLGDGRERGPHRGVARRTLLAAGPNRGRKLLIAAGRERLHAFLAIAAVVEVLGENRGAGIGYAAVNQPFEFARLRAVGRHGEKS